MSLKADRLLGPSSSTKKQLIESKKLAGVEEILSQEYDIISKTIEGIQKLQIDIDQEYFPSF